MATTPAWFLLNRRTCYDAHDPAADDPVMARCVTLSLSPTLSVSNPPEVAMHNGLRGATRTLKPQLTQISMTLVIQSMKSGAKLLYTLT